MLTAVLVYLVLLTFSLTFNYVMHEPNRRHEELQNDTN